MLQEGGVGAKVFECWAWGKTNEAELQAVLGGHRVLKQVEEWMGKKKGCLWPFQAPPVPHPTSGQLGRQQDGCSLQLPGAWPPTWLCIPRALGIEC